MDKEWNKSKKQRNLQGLIIEFLPREIYINKREFRSFVRMSVTIFSPSLRGSWIFLFSWVISPCFDRLQGYKIWFLNIPVESSNCTMLWRRGGDVASLESVTRLSSQCWVQPFILKRGLGRRPFVTESWPGLARQDSHWSRDYIKVLQACDWFVTICNHS